MNPSASFSLGSARVRVLARLSGALLGVVAFSEAAVVYAQTSAVAPEERRPRLTKAPALLEFVEARYPESELAEGKAATVVLQLAVAADGTVSEAAVVTSAGAEFDAAAIEAVKEFRFSPAEFDGVPAPVKLTYRYEFTQRVVLPTTATYRGVVVAKGTGAPQAGVRIVLSGGLETVTNERGEFSFTELPAGEIQVTLSRDDLTPLGTTETLEGGKVLEARYDIELPVPLEEGVPEEKDDFEIVVQAPRLVKQVVSTEVSAEEARRVPGTQGDVLKVVENLPGVARSAAGSSGVVVWGAAPQDTRTYVGAVRIPMLYHFGGLRSVIHNDRVQSVELIPGGYGAAYGRGLGGLVRVDDRDPAKDKLHGSAQADLLDASLAFTAPVGEKLSFAIAGRKSYIRELSTLLDDQSFQQFFTLPAYHDGQARLRYQLSPTEWIELGGMISGDEQTRTQPSSDPSRRMTDTRRLDFERVDILYRKTLEDGSELDLAPWVGRDNSGRFGNFGGVPTNATTESYLVGFRGEWRGKFAKLATGRIGLDFELEQSTSTRNGSITAPPREGDSFLFGRPPSDQVNFDQWKSTIASVAPYGEVDVALFDEKLHLTPGVRIEPYLLNIERRRPFDPASPGQGAYVSDIAVQPRFAAKYAVFERLSLKGAVGLYRQPPLADDLSAVFGNPLLGLARGQHYLVGALVSLPANVSVEATFFHTRSEALVARNAADSPVLAQALLNQGDGRSLGAQFLLRKDKGDSRFFGWVAYTLLKSERRDDPEGNWRPFDFDQTHVLTALGSYDLGLGFEFGLRARLSTGYPRTPVVDAFYNSRQGRYEPVLGRVNSDRIPLFFQLDARVTKRFKFDASELEVYLDVQNVTNRENPEEIAYSPDFAERRYILGLPILPVAGARWSF